MKINIDGNDLLKPNLKTHKSSVCGMKGVKKKII